MPRHKGEDYKISAVQYFLENDISYSKTCEIFKCSERSLKRWIDRYKEEGGIKRHSRLPISYKVTKKQVKYILKELKKNEQITMKALTSKFKKKFPNTELSRRHIGRIIRDNDKTNNLSFREPIKKDR
jgi:transposase